MTWMALRWVWRLEAPLFVGMPPAGALNRCRLYLPARAMHAAVTAELARLNGDGKSGFPDYGKFGHEVGLNCRFTYLFPAEKRGGKFLAWMPKFESARGLQWYRHDGEESLSDRDFRRRLLDSRPGTAIAPETDSASEGTLRETECINPWWRDSNCHGETNAMLLLGYVFLRNNGFRRQLDNIDTLFVGGDTRYGLGKICRMGWHEVSGDLSVFGKRVHLDREHPQIQSDIVWGHALEGGQPEIHGMQGAKELLGGWDQGSPWGRALTWAPGSFLERRVAWSIDNYGYWIHQDKR
ncbi:MAG: hypothetical protein SWH68_05640 [Thermodesulfobacteriota bacterium]|nr:hypothetical protein [Thermodesulfobacteriota bacterium]